MQNCRLRFKKNMRLKKCPNRLSATIFFFLLIIFPLSSIAQESIEFEEISVSLIVQEIGTVEIPSLISDRDEVYLPIKDVFDYLTIKNTLSSRIDSVTGFFIHPDATFLIDNISKSIHYQDNLINLKPDDLIRSENNLYLKTNYFGEVFGLVCTFNFRRLSVDLNTKIELPAIRDMRLQKMRQNIRRLVGQTKADTTIGRDFKFFHLGMADWEINNINYMEDNINNTRLNLSLGGILVGGETKATLNYSFGQSLSERNISYLWRYVNNKNHLLRQVKAGNIYTPTTASIYAPIIGVQLTNTPTSFRRSFGYHTLSDYTEPGWIVELYMNNVLVDYVKADDSGFFTFQVPLIYGNTVLNLRFYGPWGEELSRSQNISIPYNFLPAQEFEYNATAGVVRDSKNSLFARANLNYGVNRYFTIGGGIEHLSSLFSQNLIPFLRTSLSLKSNLIFYGEFAPGVKSNAILSYIMPSNLQFELNYTLYDKEQKVIKTSILEERKLAISMPVKLGNTNLYSRFNLNQTIFPHTKYTFASLLLSGSIFGLSTNFTTDARFFDYGDTQLFSNLAISYRLPQRFIIRPQMQYNYSENEISLIKCSLEKQFFDKLNMYALIENNFSYDYFNFQIGVRYELPFAQTSSSVSIANSKTTHYLSANGSFMYDGNTDYFAGNNRTSVGKGGVVIAPYLDINANNIHDLSEPKVNGLEVRINGGRVESNDRDTTIRVYDLEPYTNYFVELANSGFDYIAWQIKNQTINVIINANQFKLIEIPIAVLGEASGSVFLENEKGKNGQGRIKINFYNSDSILVSSVLSEDDGYFSFLGFKPGSYYAQIDSDQLNNLQLTSYPNVLPFKISPTFEGDFVDGLEFVLENTSEKYFGYEVDSVQRDDRGNNIDDLTGSKESMSKSPVPEIKENDLDANEKLILVLNGSVIFKTGKSNLQPNPKTGLDSLIVFMKNNPETKWVIEGHADIRGSEYLNNKLSLDRAKSVLDYFKKNGLDVSRFKVIASGESKPYADNTIDYGRELNRRVVIQEKKIYEERLKRMTAFDSINYDFLNEYNIESLIFTDNKYYCIQVSSWRTRIKAEKEVEKLRAKGHNAFCTMYRSPENKNWFRVRIGCFTNLEGAREYSKIIR